MWGYRYLGKMTPEALECTICGPQIQNFSGGGPPNPPTRNHILQISLTMCVHPPSSLALRTFQTFLPKPILAPDTNKCSSVWRLCSTCVPQNRRTPASIRRGTDVVFMWVGHVEITWENNLCWSIANCWPYTPKRTSYFHINGDRTWIIIVN